ncbi:nardilysin-like, partial [Tropilaelaps mercedesae]
YPKENEYIKFVLKHGGSANAFASRDTTVYLLEIIESALAGGLDRLAHLFIEPTLSQDAIDREIYSLEAEFWMHQCQNPFRISELISHLIGKDHPMGLFKWGNMETLIKRPRAAWIDVRNELLSFFNRYYSASNMSLCVMSNRPLDQVEQLVRTSFGAIKRLKEDHPITYQIQPKTPHLVPKPAFYKLYKAALVGKDAGILFQWVLPPQKTFYKEKAIEYLNYVIGHESSGGLYDYLHKRGWAVRLMAGPDRDEFRDNSFCTMFQIEIKLTDEGVRYLADLTGAVHQFLHMIRKAGPQRRLWDELQQMNETNFCFQSPTEPVEYVQEVAVAMQYFPLEHYLCGPILFMRYDAEHIQSLMNLLTPDKCNILLLSSEFAKETAAFNQREPSMGILYKIEDYPDSWRRLWSDDSEFQNEFRFPEQNPFAATDFSVEVDRLNKGVPRLIRNTSRTRLWYLSDSRYFLPKCFVNIRFLSNLSETMQSQTCTELMLRVLTQLLAEINSYAEVASLEVDVALEFKFSGFNATLPSLVKIVMKTLCEFDCSDTVFETVKITMMRDQLNSTRQNKLYADDILSAVLYNNFAPLSEKYRCLERLTKDDVVQRAHELCGAPLEAYVHGNIDWSKVLMLFIDIESILEKRISETLPGEYNKGPKNYGPPAINGDTYVRALSTNPVEKCSRIVNFYMYPITKELDDVIVQLLVMLMRQEVIQHLRTSWKLGYDPECSMKYYDHSIGFTVSISPMADRHTLSYIDDKFDEFVEKMFRQFTCVDRAEFEAAKDVLVKVKPRPTDPLTGHQQQRYWGQIAHKIVEFSPIGTPCTMLNASQLSCETFRLCVSRMISSRVKLSVQVVAYGKAALEECIGGDVIWQQYDSKPNKDLPEFDDMPRVKRLLIPKNAGMKKYLIGDFDKLFPRPSVQMRERAGSRYCGVNRTVPGLRRRAQRADKLQGNSLEKTRIDAYVLRFRTQSEGGLSLFLRKGFNTAPGN